MKKSLLLLAGILVLGCSDNLDQNIEPELEQPVWQEDDRFLFDNKAFNNSAYNDDGIYFAGLFYGSMLRNDGDNEDVTSVRVNYDQNYKMPISDLLFLNASESKLNIRPSQSMLEEEYIDMKEVDPEFYSFDFPNRWSSEAMLVNSKKQCLVPYRVGSPASGLVIKFLLIDIDLIDDNGRYFVDVKNIEILDFLGAGYYTTTLFCINDIFFVNNPFGTYIIDTEGNHQQVSDDPLYDTFYYDRFYYGIANYGRFYKSSDAVSWSQVGELSSTFSLLDYTLLDGKNIGFRNSQIWIISPNESEIETTELDNTGLDGNQITSIGKFNGKIYVTTYSGIYYKDEEDFWTPRESE